MGIQGLGEVLGDHAPDSVKEHPIKSYFGRKIAVDTSMSLYQFLIAVRPTEGALNGLIDESGETTSHLQGLLQRTIRMLKNGIKPCFVFDGKPPELKQKLLEKRHERRVKAEEGKKEAIESGNVQAQSKYSKRTVKMSEKHIQEAKKLLQLMGMPVIEAPGEAEAQCVEMARGGLVFAVGTDDMDALTFGAPIQLRYLTFAEIKNRQVAEIHLDKVLEGLEMSMDQFIDFCILLGCDYCDSIRGIGPVRAYEMIKKHESIEGVVENLDQKKYPIPENFDYKVVRQLFIKPDVLPASSIELKWTDPDAEGLIQYLVKEKGFSEERVLTAIDSLKHSKSAVVQERLTKYFGEPVKQKKEEKESKEESPKKKAKVEKGKGKSPKGKAAGKHKALNHGPKGKKTT